MTPRLRLEKVLLELRQRHGDAGARRAAAIRTQVDEAKVTLAFNLSGWDRLAWLPLAIELELPLAGLRALFFRHWTPDQARPAPERFLETLRELAAALSGRHGGGGLLLQIPEQRQPEASVRDLLLQWLPSLPGLVLAFTQHDVGRECDYQDLEPLRPALQPLTAADLDQRLTGCLGTQALPRPLLQAVAVRAQGSPGLAALTLVDLAQRHLIGPDPAGVWRLRDQAEALADLDQLFGPGLFRPLHGLIERVRADAGPESAADLRGFMDHGCLCGRNIAFGIVADCLDLDEARRDRLLDLLDAHLVEPQGDPAAANLSVHPLPPTPSHAGAPESFNVFLSHNSRDKPAVRQLAQALQARGLKVWLDEEELVPGRPWQEAVERIIQSVHTAAVLVGRDGLGPWEAPEMRACLSQCVTRRLPVIPVLLPDAPVEPALPLFLQAFTWVDLRAGLTDDGLNRLEWGITGLKPNELPSPRLSPAVRGNEQSADDAPVPEPQLDYLGCRHPDFPDQEVFRFRNPLLAQHLRNRQSRRDRQQRAQALLARLAAVLPPHNRGIAELHLAVLDHVGDEARRRALDGELFYWLDAAHARSAGRELVADLKARRVSPGAVWGAIEQNQDRWPIWRQLAWLDAYGRQPHGVPEGMRGFWLNRLAIALYHAGEFERALGVAEESLELVRAAEGPNSTNAATVLSVMAAILTDLGQLGSALARNEETLAIRRQALSAGHPDIAASLNNIASALNKLGRHQEALELHEEGLAIRRETLPAGHPNIAQSLNNIALVLDALGRHQEALEPNEEALTIRRKALPAGHPDIATSLHDIGWPLTALGRPAEAKAHWEEAFAINAARAADAPAELLSDCRRYANQAAKHGDHPGALYWLDKALDLIPAQPTAGLPDPDALRREITQQRADLAADGAASDPPP